MRHRVVHGVDGRVWEITIRTERPAGIGVGDDGFEHDVSGQGSTIFILGTLIGFWLILFIWKPAGVIIPWYFWLIGLLVVGFFPCRWWLRRPISLLAETPGDYELPAERWAGHVRGGRNLREEMRILTRRLRTQGTPGHTDSPLHPIDTPSLNTEPSDGNHNPPTVELPIEEDE